MTRTPQLQQVLDELQQFLDGLKETLVSMGEDRELLEAIKSAGGHDYNCRCEKCRQWWESMGPDPDTGKYGPFEREEIEGGQN